MAILQSTSALATAAKKGAFLRPGYAAGKMAGKCGPYSLKKAMKAGSKPVPPCARHGRLGACPEALGAQPSGGPARPGRQHAAVAIRRVGRPAEEDAVSR